MELVNRGVKEGTKRRERAGVEVVKKNEENIEEAKKGKREEQRTGLVVVEKENTSWLRE